MPRRYRLGVALDLEHVKGRVEAFDYLQVEMREDELETAACVGGGWRKAGELYAGGDLADFWNLAAEHEEVAGRVEVRGVVVGVSFVEDGETGWVEF